MDWSSMVSPEAGLVHFIRPGWLAMLPMAVILPLLWRYLRRPSGDWTRVCDPHLLRWLSVGQESARTRGLGYWLAGLGVAIAVLSLAGPSWQKLPDSSFSARDARVIVLDLSRSMLAQDLRPDRLTRARYRLADLLSATSEGQTGLVAYAGDAYVVSPLTNDMNTIANLLPALQPDIIPVSGSRADRGLDMAAALLERAGFANGEILLVTDSVDSGDASKARELADRGIRTSVMAVGTADGAPIPSGAGFVTDRAGNVVISRLDRRDIGEVATAGGGRYTELGVTPHEESPWLEGEGSDFERRDDALGERWKDTGPWFVLLLLPLALLGFRRGQLFVLPLLLAPALLLAPRPAAADWWDDLWSRRDQQAYDALQMKEAERAAALAEDPALSGEAWFRSGQYENAAASWAGLGEADAHYNRGNALAHLGALEDALSAYDDALALDPEMEDAIKNRSIVEQMLEEQQQQQQQQDSEQSDGESQEQQDSESSEQSESEESQEGEEGEQQEGEQEQQQSEQSEQQRAEEEMVQAWTEEDAQAMEQWLRRIPDDPGGLLRRKFRNEHQRRGAPDDDKDPW